MELISDDISSLYKEAYGEEISETFAAYMYHISHLDEISSESEKAEKLNDAILEEIKFVTEIPDIVERLPCEIEKYDKSIRMGGAKMEKIAKKEYASEDFSEEKIKTLSELKGIFRQYKDVDLRENEVKRLHKERILKKYEDIS